MIPVIPISSWTWPTSSADAAIHPVRTLRTRSGAKDGSLSRPMKNDSIPL